MERQGTRSEERPWKGMLMALGALVVLAVLLGVAAAFVDDATDVASGPQLAAADAPPPRVIEDCNRHAAEAQRNAAEIVKDGVVGGAVGAGVGAAGGAIADGGEGAGKGAGIGALVGAAAGTLVGLSEENRRTEAARAAYADCMARRGY